MGWAQGRERAVIVQKYISMYIRIINIPPFLLNLVMSHERVNIGRKEYYMNFYTKNSLILFDYSYTTTAKKTIVSLRHSLQYQNVNTKMSMCHVRNFLSQIT